MARTKESMERERFFKWSRLIDCRELRGLSQIGLAKRAGICAAQISDYESGKEKPGTKNLVKLADALSVSVDCLLEHSPLPKTVRLYDVESALDFIEATHEQSISKEIKMIKTYIEQQKKFPNSKG